MYRLLVYYPETKGSHLTVTAERSAEVLDLIPRLLSEHLGCEHIVVFMGETRLFAVDCAGNRLP
jgi:hypothetical protein